MCRNLLFLYVVLGYFGGFKRFLKTETDSCGTTYDITKNQNYPRTTILVMSVFV